MKISGKQILALGVVSFATILLGCATTHRHSNMLSLTGARVEVLPGDRGDDVEIRDARVYQHGGDLVVLGEALRTGQHFTSDEGHIDIAVVQPGKEPMVRAAEYKHHPSRQTLSRFDVHFPASAKPGTRIYIVFHPLNDDGREHSAAMEMLLDRARS